MTGSIERCHSEHTHTHRSRTALAVIITIASSTELPIRIQLLESTSLPQQHIKLRQVLTAARRRRLDSAEQSLHLFDSFYRGRLRESGGWMIFCIHSGLVARLRESERKSDSSSGAFANDALFGTCSVRLGAWPKVSRLHRRCVEMKKLALKNHERGKRHLPLSLFSSLVEIGARTILRLHTWARTIDPPAHCPAAWTLNFPLFAHTHPLTHHSPMLPVVVDGDHDDDGDADVNGGIIP